MNIEGELLGKIPGQEVLLVMQPILIKVVGSVRVEIEVIEIGIEIEVGKREGDSHQGIDMILTIKNIVEIGIDLGMVIEIETETEIEEVAGRTGIAAARNQSPDPDLTIEGQDHHVDVIPNLQMIEINFNNQILRDN